MYLDFSEHMNLRQKDVFMQILDCLAIIAFFGAINSEEAESAMHIIWNYINPEFGYDVRVFL